jgi:hypothetical protein
VLLPDAIHLDGLRAHVRQRLARGSLPLAMASNINAGYGSSVNNCGACGLLIRCEQVEYEVRTQLNEILTFHVNCYRAWRDECLASSVESA